MKLTRVSFPKIIWPAGFLLLISIAAFAQSEPVPSALKVGILPFTNSTANQLHLDNLRAQLIQELHRWNIEGVPLKQKNLKKAREEAQNAGCKYVVDTDVNAGTLGELRSNPGMSPQGASQSPNYDTSGSTDFRLIEASSGKILYKQVLQEAGGVSSAEAAFSAIQDQAQELTTELHVLEKH